MPALIVPKAFKMQVLWTRDGVFAAENVLGLYVGVDATVLDSALTVGICNAYKDAFAATLGSVNGLSSHWSPVTGVVTDIRTLGGPEFTEPIGGVGSSGGKDLPAQCSLVTKITTALRGRRYRGRTFWPGLPESAINGNQSDLFLTGSIESFWAQFQTKLGLLAGGGNLQSGVISRKFHEIHAATGFSTGTKVFTQRRRENHV
jgi:hypothetical protein